MFRQNSPRTMSRADNHYPRMHQDDEARFMFSGCHHRDSSLSSLLEYTTVRGSVGGIHVVQVASAIASHGINTPRCSWRNAWEQQQHLLDCP
jgi:hypothetical protein